MIQLNGSKCCAKTSLGTELYKNDFEPRQLDQLTSSGHYFAFIYLYDSQTKRIATKRIGHKTYCYKTYQLQKVSPTKHIAY